MITIEITKEITEHFLKTKYETPDYCPFDEPFAIVFPATACFDGKKMSIISKMKNLPKYTAIFEITNCECTIKCYLGKELLLECRNGNDDEVKYSSSLPKEFEIALVAILLDIFAGVLYQFSIPTIEKKVDEVRERKTSDNEALHHYSSSKRYVYKTRYKFDSIATPRKPKERHTTAWNVIGHIRRLRDEKGEIYKEVWVKPHVKGNGVPKESEYKITRL